MFVTSPSSKNTHRKPNSTTWFLLNLEKKINGQVFARCIQGGASTVDCFMRGRGYCRWGAVRGKMGKIRWAAVQGMV
jgi:hypothetical protein